MTYGMILLAIVFGLVVTLAEPVRFFLSVVLALAFCGGEVRKAWRQKQLSPEWVRVALLFSLILAYQILKEELPFFYFWLEKAALGFSGLVGKLIGRPLALGITYSGLDVLVFFLLAMCLDFLFFAHRKQGGWALFFAGSALLLWGIYLSLWTVLAENSLPLGLNLLEPLTGALDYRLLLFVLLLGNYYSFQRNLEQREIHFSQGIRRIATGLAVLFAGIWLLLQQMPVLAPAEGEGKVLFWDTGIDFSLPKTDAYGLNYVGMFGVLPEYLKSKGYACKLVNTIQAEDLKESKILVVINPMRSPDKKELAAIWQFVKDGGSVLAAGDHTGWQQIRLPLNEILKPAGIRLNFDSAVGFKEMWGGEYTLRSEALFSGVDRRQIQLVVGASLQLESPAKPLILAKEGFSDKGDENASMDGYLGDLHFNRGERLGDLILAAEADYGKGKFLAFGDTTLLQNTVISYSYPLIDNIFAYLGGEVSSAPKGFRAAAILDMTHGESWQRNRSEDSADGLIANLLRAGIFPYVCENGSLLSALREKDAKLLVLTEPALEFSKEELRQLKEFMENGGNILLCAGYTSPKSSQALAGYFGFSFEKMPIGRIAPNQNPEMAFWMACPALYKGGAPKQSGEAVSLVEIWDHSVIAYKAIGQGRFYCVADPDFLKNKNLEHIEGYREGNVLFVQKLLQELLTAL